VQPSIQSSFVSPTRRNRRLDFAASLAAAFLAAGPSATNLATGGFLSWSTCSSNRSRFQWFSSSSPAPWKLIGASLLCFPGAWLDRALWLGSPWSYSVGNPVLPVLHNQSPVPSDRPRDPQRGGCLLRRNELVALLHRPQGLEPLKFSDSQTSGDMKITNRAVVHT